MSIYQPTPAAASLRDELIALRQLTASLTRQIEAVLAGAGGDLNLDQPAGKLAQQIWRRAGRRRALITATKIYGIAASDRTRPAVAVQRPVVRGNGVAKPVIEIVDHYAVAAE